MTAKLLRMRAVSELGTDRQTSRVSTPTGTVVHDDSGTRPAGSAANVTGGLIDWLRHAVNYRSQGAGTQARAIVASLLPAKVNPMACLCVNCGEVSNTVRNCPVCQSVAMLNISRLLDR